MPIRILHPSTGKLGGSSKKKIPRSEDSCIKNRLQVRLLSGHPSFCDGTPNSHPASGTRACNPDPLPHIWRHTLPFQMGVISETICDLANKLLKCKDWEPTNLHALVQHKIPKHIYQDEDIPFVVGRELIVDIPIDHQGYANVYINDTTRLTVDLPGTRIVSKQQFNSWSR